MLKWLKKKKTEVRALGRHLSLSPDKARRVIEIRFHDLYLQFLETYKVLLSNPDQ